MRIKRLRNLLKASFLCSYKWLKVGDGHLLGKNNRDDMISVYNGDGIKRWFESEYVDYE